MHLADNLRFIRKQRQLGQQELADLLSIPRTTYSKWELSGTPRIEELVRLSQYLNVSIDSLLLTRMEDATGESAKPNDPFRVLTIVTDTHNEENIVLVDVKALAGYAKGYGDPQFVKQLPAFSLPGYKFKSATFRGFEITGDSMEQTLFEGDILVCSFVEPQHWHTIKENHVYVLVLKDDTDGVVVKRVHQKTDTGVVLQSDNPFYQPFTRQFDQVAEIWYARRRITPYLPTPANVSHYLQTLNHKIDQVLKKL
jgi:transcriptional regulator with XRE-family HTH domain